MRPALPALLLGATCIALSPIFVRFSETGPTATAFWRTALALPVLWPLFFLRDRSARPATTAGWTLVLAAGLAFAGDLAFWHAAIGLTSVANSTLLANLASIFVTLAAWAFFGQRPSAVFLAGLAVALGGVVLLVQSSLRLSTHGLLGDVFGVVTALFYALLPVAVVSGERIVPLSSAGWLDLLGLALVSHAAGQGLIAYALAHSPAAFSAVSLLLQPVMAALFAWMLLAEPLAPLQLAGGAVVLTGIYLARRGSA